MTFPKTIVLALAGIILIVTPTSTNSAKPRVARIKTVEVKVGITEYSKIQRTYQNYERLFRELAASSNSTDAVLFRFAVGTYGEVRDWYNKGMIDVAILSAMPVGELLLAGDDTNLEKAYIGDLSVSAPPNTQSVLSLFSDRKHDPFYYQAGCLFLRSDKELLTIAESSNPLPELKKLWDAGTLRFLFVRPYSLSGYIAPVRMLKEHGIDPLLKPKQMQF